MVPSCRFTSSKFPPPPAGHAAPPHDGPAQRPWAHAAHARLLQTPAGLHGFHPGLPWGLQPQQAPAGHGDFATGPQRSLADADGSIL